jgi:hypothetical protein
MLGGDTKGSNIWAVERYKQCTGTTTLSLVQDYGHVRKSHGLHNSKWLHDYIKSDKSKYTLNP